MNLPSRRRPHALATSAIAAILSIGVVLGFRALRPTHRAEAYAARQLVPATRARLAFESGLDSLAARLDILQSSIRSGDVPRARRQFRATRQAYKRTEALLVFVAPEVAAILNGPLANDDGDAPPRPLGSPAAFGRVRDGLSSEGLADSARRRVLVDDTQEMRKAVNALRWGTAYLRVQPQDALDAARMELARMTTLDLAGFDLGPSNDALADAADALDGTRTLVRAAIGNDTHTDAPFMWRDIDVSLASAVGALRQATNFDSLDRFTFILRHVVPASRAIARARASYAQTRAPRRSVWRESSASVFDRDALDASAYAPEFAPRPTRALLALGQRMFFDPVLSGPETRACASCHIPDKAFTDGRPLPLTLGPTPAVRRNTPTLINAAFQPFLFADERAGSLEEQVGVVLASPAEMQSSAPLAASRLQRSPEYRDQFRQAFGTRADSVITELQVRTALAAYVRSLTALRSRFDRAIQGDESALTPVERAGFNVFMGKARCGTCHFAPLFSGTMPPSFTNSEPEIILAGSAARRHAADADSGRFLVDHVDQHRFAFKVPTLRNIELTPPYMHNGAFRTLEDVVDFYNRGGATTAARGIRPTLAREPLHLSRDERRAVIAFMQSLTDTSLTTRRCLAGTCADSRVAKM